MNKIFRFFGGFKKMMASVAQIIISVILLPALCFLWALLVGEGSATSVISNLLKQLPVIGFWYDFYTSILEANEKIRGMYIYLSSIEYINSALFDSCVVGMCVSLCKNIGIILGIKGIPLIQSILGIFLGCIFVTAFGLSNDMYTFFYCSVLIVLNLIVIWLMPTMDNIRKILATFLGLGLQMIIMVLTAGYVVYLTLILRGIVTEIRMIVSHLLILTFPLLIVMVIDYFLLTPEKMH